ncbi:hypothetical protein HII31_10876 [Pseudocercospora fuligena]|uniref:Uncharacterized protein n=1 Tax=Pseudocercospora fuligena TaxID=685502 RepID=A0A8H6RBB4_9PEZI|nr:hypothetical protein HII31_10876 [Pseudocercospora fuligena]
MAYQRHDEFMEKTIEVYDLSIDEYTAHVFERSCDNSIRLCSAISVADETGFRQQTENSETLWLVKYIRANDEVHVVRRGSTEKVYTTPGGMLQRCARPSYAAMMQILSGNQYLIEQTAKKGKARQTKRTAGVRDGFYESDGVYKLTRGIRLRTLDRTVVDLCQGTEFDVMTTPLLSMKFIIRFGTDEQRFAIITDLELETDAIKAKHGQSLNECGGEPMNLAVNDRLERKLFLVLNDIYAVGGGARSVCITRGQCVQQYVAAESGLLYFAAEGDRRFVADHSIVLPEMEEIPVESMALSKAAAFAVYPFTPMRPHTLHNDQVTLAEIHALSNEGMILPKSSTWMPMISRDRTPLRIDYFFGYWVFESQEDNERARTRGLSCATDVANHGCRGVSGLGDIMIGWQPGELDASQAPFFASVYVHIAMIDRRRMFWFGKEPAAPNETPVYTGSDPYAHERSGARNIALDNKMTVFSYDDRAAPTEREILKQMQDRQGYLARSLDFPAESLRVPTTAAAQQAQDAILKASNRNVQIGRPFAMLHPVNETAGLNLRTSFHPAYVDLAHGEKMHESVYLFHRHSSLLDDVYANKSKKLAILDQHLPLLSANGEVTRTFVAKQKKSVQEITLRDYPFLPQCIAPDEDYTLLRVFFDFCKDAEQIAGRMNEAVRPYWNLSNSHKVNEEMWLRTKGSDEAPLNFGGKPDEETLAAAKGRVNRDKIVKHRPIKNSHKQRNTLRGIASGLIDPRRPGNVQVRDVTGQWGLNWIDFPPTKSHVERLVEWQKSVNNSALKERRDMIKAQSKAGGTEVRKDSCI